MSHLRFVRAKQATLCWRAFAKARILYLALLRPGLVVFILAAGSTSASPLTDRLTEVLAPGVLTEAGALGPDVTRYKVPPFQDRGRNNHGLFRRAGGPPTFIKVHSFNSEPTPDNVDLARPILMEDTLGLLLGEAAGGPRVHRAGLYAAEGWLNLFWEFEFLFPDETNTFTYKGTLNGLHPALAGYGMKYRFRELTTLITRALDRSIYIRDADVIISPHGVRWLDTTAWTVVRPLGQSHLDRVVAILRWAEKVQRGQGWLMYLRLRRHVTYSAAFDTNVRHRILEGLFDFEKDMARRSCGPRLGTTNGFGT